MIEPARAAVILAAHGDRGGRDRNAVLRRHADALRARGLFGAVGYGVLNGEPNLEKALHDVDSANAEFVLVYPFFMSSGYFVERVRARVAAARPARQVLLHAPFGLDPTLPALLFDRCLEAAREAEFDPATARLLVIGHGSKFGRASADATNSAAAAIAQRGVFLKVKTAFLEEPPFLAEALSAERIPTVAAGFFAAEGMHGHDDVPEAIATADVPCIYTRPIGSHPGIAALIETAAIDAMREALPSGGG